MWGQGGRGMIGGVAMVVGGESINPLYRILFPI